MADAQGHDGQTLRHDRYHGLMSKPDARLLVRGRLGSARGRGRIAAQVWSRLGGLRRNFPDVVITPDCSRLRRRRMEDLR